MLKVHIKKNDQVYILSGKERGKVGKVLRVFPGERRAVVEGLNFIQKHTRPIRRRTSKAESSRKSPRSTSPT